MAVQMYTDNIAQPLYTHDTSVKHLNTYYAFLSCPRLKMTFSNPNIGASNSNDATKAAMLDNTTWPRKR